MRKVLVWIVASGFVLGLVGVVAVNASMYIYPAKGQSQKKQDQDEYGCHNWAVEQTGVDPMKMADLADLDLLIDDRELPIALAALSASSMSPSSRAILLPRSAWFAHTPAKQSACSSRRTDIWFASV